MMIKLSKERYYELEFTGTKKGIAIVKNVTGLETAWLEMRTTVIQLHLDCSCTIKHGN